MVVTGDLTESGSLRQFGQATRFLTGLRLLLGLEPHRLVIVPGPRDVTKAAASAYFLTCEADDVSPQPPYWPKWRHFAGLFGELYQGLDDRVFDGGQPWTLFQVPDLKVVVAGLNSTMAYEPPATRRLRPARRGTGRLVRRAAAPLRGARAGCASARIGHPPARATARRPAAAPADADVLARPTARSTCAARSSGGPATAVRGGPSPRPAADQVARDHPRGARAPGCPTAAAPGAGSAHVWRAAQATFTGETPAGPRRAAEPRRQDRRRAEPGRAAARPDHRGLRGQARAGQDPPHAPAASGGHPPPRTGSSGSSGSARTSGELDRRRTPTGSSGRRTPPTRARRPSWSTRARRPPGRCATTLMRRGVRLRSFTEFQGLLDLSRLRRRADGQAHHRPPLPARRCTSRSATATRPARPPGQGRPRPTS